MAKEITPLSANTVLSVGEGMKVAYVNQATSIELPEYSLIIKTDLKELFGQTEKSNKTYVGNTKRITVKIGNDIYDINAYVLKHNKEEKANKASNGKVAF